MKRAWIVLLTISLSGVSLAQLSGYASVGAGYDGNPMSNYAKVGDRTGQASIVLRLDQDFDESALALVYSGNFAAFDVFRDRNYYEHGLDGRYDISLDTPGDDSEATTPPADSAGRYLSLLGRFGSRMDKAVFADFDNRVLSVGGSYRVALSPGAYFRLTDILSSRAYPNVPELSATTNALSGEIGSGTSAFSYGGVLAFNYKMFTQSGYDSSRFDASASLGPGHGRNKGITGMVSTTGKTKKILLQPTSRTTSQISLHGFAVWKWAEKSLAVRVIYQLPASSATRYVAQASTSSMLTDDLYNDEFNYSGPKVAVEYSQPLPMNISCTLDAELQRRSYGVAALLLDGTATSDNRTDTRLGASAYLSHSLFAGFDFSLGLSFISSSSNDEYNNFSGYSLTVALGYSF